MADTREAKRCEHGNIIPGCLVPFCKGRAEHYEIAVADTREIRELAEQFRNSDEYGRICDTTYSVEEEELQVLTAFAESIVEQCCKAVCSECCKGDQPERFYAGTEGGWYHKMLGFDDRTEKCQATSIRSRWQRGERR